MVKKKKSIPQQDLLGVKWNTDLGKPQFHVPVQKQHHDFYSTRTKKVIHQWKH